MLRTRATAQEVAERLALSTEVDPGWVEASFGAWENLTHAEVARRYPAELASWQGSVSFAPAGGEPLGEVAERVRQARRRAVDAHPGQVVVVVTHGTPVRAVVQEAMAAGDAALWRTRVTPGALTAVRYWPDGGVEVVTVNAAGHLAAP
jgi:broad specificity phosphatase PhoE